jgi:hypothetical protein
VVSNSHITSTPTAITVVSTVVCPACTNGHGDRHCPRLGSKQLTESVGDTHMYYETRSAAHGMLAAYPRVVCFSAVTESSSGWTTLRSGPTAPKLQMHKLRSQIYLDALHDLQTRCIVCPIRGRDGNCLKRVNTTQLNTAHRNPAV